MGTRFFAAWTRVLPRFTLLPKNIFPTAKFFETVDKVFQVVPKVLQEYSEERVKAGKKPIANCWPNVDAISGALVRHFGITEFSYYTVLFAVGRTIGLLAQLILARALGLPITRPKSVSLDWLENEVKKNK